MTQMMEPLPQYRKEEPWRCRLGWHSWTRIPPEAWAVKINFDGYIGRLVGPWCTRCGEKRHQQMVFESFADANE
jgi:hypothetical protein